MPVEGISMTTVFSLVTVGMVMSIAAFLGGSYLKPSFDITAVMTSVAYDLAAMYDIAYTMPGEVKIRYYGPDICKWNYHQKSDSATSFHCFSGQAVMINEVVVDNELLLTTKDPYMKYDEKKDYEIPIGATSLYYPRPSVSRIDINYYDAQICPFEGTYKYCALASAPFAADYNDLDLITAPTPYNVRVEDYSFVVEKKNVGNFYSTVDRDVNRAENLINFLRVLIDVYTNVCKTPDMLIVTDGSGNPISTEVVGYGSGLGDITTDDLSIEEAQKNFVQLIQSYRWHVYNETIICEERLVVDKEGRGGSELTEVDLNEYVTNYCFNITSLTDKNECDSINEVIFTQDFINYVNNRYNYYASWTSCLKPVIKYDEVNEVLKIDALKADYNPITGSCVNMIFGEELDNTETLSEFAESADAEELSGGGV